MDVEVVRKKKEKWFEVQLVDVDVELVDVELVNVDIELPNIKVESEVEQKKIQQSLLFITSRTLGKQCTGRCSGWQIISHSVNVLPFNRQYHYHHSRSHCKAAWNPFQFIRINKGSKGIGLYP